MARIEKKQKLVGYANFVRHNPKSDRFEFKNFDHIEFFHQARNLFAERIDMISPNPIIRVTIDVPP